MRTDPDARAMQAALDALKDSVPDNCFQEDGRWFRGFDTGGGDHEVSEHAAKLEAIAKLEAALAQPDPAPDPVAWHTEDYLTDKSATTYSAEVAGRWREKGWPVTPHYTTKEKAS